MNILRRGMPSLVLFSLVSSLQAGPTPSAAPWLDTHVTIDVRQAPLGTFLDTLSAQAKVNFILAGGVENKKVTAFLHDVTVRDALDVLREARGIGYRQLAHTNTFIVAPKDSSEINNPLVIEGGKELDQRVTVRVKDAPIDQFLDTISAQTKMNFILDEDLEDMKVTAFLQNVTVREALEVVMTIKGLDCKLSDTKKAYVMSKRQELR
jgi:type II secretory pathway component GspD/PulD (secretin)